MYPKLTKIISMFIWTKYFALCFESLYIQRLFAEEEGNLNSVSKFLQAEFSAICSELYPLQHIKSPQNREKRKIALFF